MLKLIFKAVAFAVVVGSLLAGCGGDNSTGSGGGGGGTFTDKRDGKQYKTVKIGVQTWMAENLNYYTSSSKCYGDDASICTAFGRLYTWNAAISVCPDGWHLPDNDEWRALINHAGGESTAGTKLKSKLEYWLPYDYESVPAGTDTYGFSALPGGRGGTASGEFRYIGTDGFWWSASADRLNICNCNEEANLTYADANFLFSVRCVQD